MQAFAIAQLDRPFLDKSSEANSASTGHTLDEPARSLPGNEYIARAVASRETAPPFFGSKLRYSSGCRALACDSTLSLPGQSTPLRSPKARGRSIHHHHLRAVAYPRVQPLPLRRG